MEKNPVVAINYSIKSLSLLSLFQDFTFLKWGNCIILSLVKTETVRLGTKTPLQSYKRSDGHNIRHGGDVSRVRLR